MFKSMGTKGCVAGFHRMMFGHQKKYFQLFGGVEQEVPSAFAAQSEPWLQATLTGFGQGIRRQDNERVILWVNYVPAGVVSAKQHAFTVEQITQLCHQYPKTCAAVIFMPNRAGDLRGGSPMKHLGFLISSFVAYLGLFPPCPKTRTISTKAGRA